MGFGFKQPLVGEKRCVTTLITAAKETIKIGGPWTRSMKGVHGPGPYFDGPGSWTRSTEGVHGPGVHVLYFPRLVNGQLVTFNKLEF